MKSVLISIQPKWCELIANGKKTVEVRKTKPKLETPFKVYIYATNPKKWFKFSSFGYASDESLWLSNGKVKMCDGFEFWADNAEYEPLNGKVIGEFVCNQIDTYDDDTIHAFSHEDYSKWNDFDLYNSCVHPEDFERYANDNWLYGWHISDLVIYDTPKELREFTKPYGTIIKAFDSRFITRPPQSWCYVERLGGAE